MPRVTPAHVLLTTDTVGGVWHYTLTLARAWQRMGVRCTIATLGPPLSGAQRHDCDGLDLSETDLPLDWLAADTQALSRAADELLRRARACGAEALHLHSPAFAVRADIPTVAVAHSCVATWWAAMRDGPMPADFAWRAEMMARGMAAADAVIVPTHDFAGALGRHYPGTAGIAVVHNGIAAEPPCAAGRENYVLAAGRLWDEAKGMAVLDHAAPAIAVPVCVAGPLEGPGGARLMPCHVRPLGALTAGAMREAQVGAAVFVAPARYEPFGLAVLEAAALGTPLVLADIGSFRELWHGAAVFVPAASPDAWAGAINRLLADRHERAALGGAAQARAQRYTDTAMATGTLAVHSRVAARQFAPAALC